jgi:uridine kinase
MTANAGDARGEAIGAIVEAIDAVRCPHPLRVAVDGPPCAGKTTLADELAVAVGGRGRDVIRASIEGFLRPRIERYRQGPDSPRGCYEDSFDFERLWGELLAPLGEGGSRLYRTQIYDRRADRPVPSRQLKAPADAVLIFDGVFLLRPELVDAWDFRVFVSTGFEENIRRIRSRDAEEYGSPDRAEQRYRSRYLPSQQRYFQTVRPTELTHVVITNDDPSRPTVHVAE